nr:hypothetical protein [Candidatus Woesearchaeota archaeon]
MDKSRLEILAIEEERSRVISELEAIRKEQIKLNGEEDSEIMGKMNVVHIGYNSRIDELLAKNSQLREWYIENFIGPGAIIHGSSTIGVDSSLGMAIRAIKIYGNKLTTHPYGHAIKAKPSLDQLEKR